MRRWWIDAIARIQDYGLFPYSQCTLEHPPPVFEDATARIEAFNSDFDAGDARGYINAVKNESVMLPNVLCPFGCAEFCRAGNHIGWGLVLQRMLLRILLPLSKKDRDGYRFIHLLQTISFETRPITTRF